MDCIIKRTTEIRVHSGNFENVFSAQNIDQNVWRKTDGYPINLRLNPNCIKILEKSRSYGSRLSDICEVLYGIKTGNNEKYLSASKSDRHTVKALKSGEIVRYKIEWKGLFLWWCNDLAGYRLSPIQVPKIVIQYIRKLSLPRRLIAALDFDGKYYPLNNYSYLTLRDKKYSLMYVLGLINSKLLNYYFANTFVDYNIKPAYLQQLPIRTIDFNNPKEKAMHD
ncbi:MAG TPA: TaqI-like C-terminal specificity domain-containing protein, partial [Candidatus Avalokitesvara rifleensis]|uniref:TaqI-like C-terminal specificity domain-containing protein n=1 Tax=Candidatus Avalokitesvara rifleensis TaxID=3367620 RepID=UPI0040264B2F